MRKIFNLMAPVMRGAGLTAGAGLAILTLVATTATAQPAPPEGGPLHKLHIMPPPAFADIDSNKDGVISKSEFDAFHDAHKPMTELKDMKDGPPPGAPRHRGQPDIKSLDTNGDGKISLEEFSVPMKAHFTRLDANHDGVLEASEMPAMSADQGPPPPPAN